MSAMSGHTVKSFSTELEELSAELARMGGLVEDMLADAILAVVSGDRELAGSVVRRDKDVDALQIGVEKRILSLLALRQPLARDLRQTVVALKVAADLERIGDLAKNVAKRAAVLETPERLDRISGVERMGRLVSDQLKRVLDAFNMQDKAAAIDVWERDEEVDEHYNSIFRVMLTFMMEDPRTISACTHLLFMAKNLERMGDHCTNIAETIHFLVTGEYLPSERPKSDDLETR